MSVIIDNIEMVGALGSAIIILINVIKFFTHNEDSETNKKILINIIIGSIIFAIFIFGGKIIGGYDNYKLELAEVTQEEVDAANLYRIQVITYNTREKAIALQKILKEGNIDTEISQKRDEEGLKFILIAYKGDKGEDIEDLNSIKVELEEKINEILREAGIPPLDIGIYAENKYIENAISDFKNFKTQYNTTEDNKEKNKLNNKMNIIRSELKDYLFKDIYSESEKNFEYIDSL